jgi:benzoyl-CoA reductase subunit C
VKPEDNKKKIGWLCSYVPIEIITAAGLEPVRLFPEPEDIDKTGALLPANFCIYLNKVMNSALNGRFDDLGGIVFANSCDCMRRLYDLWSRYLNMPFVHMLEVPRNRNRNGVEYFTQRLRTLKSDLETAFGVQVLDSELQKAVDGGNMRRKAMETLFDGQKTIPPQAFGSDLMAACLADTRGEPVPSALGAQPNTGPRVLVMGQALDTPDLFHMIEAAGGTVVVFDTCLGLRGYEDTVPNQGDPLQALAQRYLLRPACPRMPGYGERLDRLGKLVDEFSIHGVIQTNSKFCDYGLFETPQIEGFLRDKGLPFLALEHDYHWSDAGRIQVRVDAFLEMVETPNTAKP